MRSMYRGPRVLVVLIVVLVVLGMATAAIAGPNGARPDRPFKADFTGTRAIVDDPGRCDAGWLALDIYLDKGPIAHLGMTEGTAEQCVNPATGVIALGFATYVAANGDELYATYTGQVQASGVILVEQTFNGGTGRFEHATGSADEVVSVDGMTVQGTIDGTISY